MNKDIGIFWDYENARVYAEGIKVPLAEKLLEFARSEGLPTVMRVYADWTKESKISQSLFAMGFETIHSPMNKTNSVDILLSIDVVYSVMDVDFLHKVILVTGDKDYIPLVNRLKREAVEVIIVAPAKTASSHLQLSSDRFISFEDLKKMNFDTPDNDDEQAIIPFDEATKVLEKAIKELSKNGKQTSFSLVDQYMRLESSKYIGVKYIEHPKMGKKFKKFTDFIAHAERQGIVHTHTDGNINEVFVGKSEK